MTALNPKLSVIGSATKVSFPEYGIDNVPAKIDTGADSSSMWASKIQQKGDVLSFVLFDQQSPFYKGEAITTKSFSTQMVRNSFGHTEIRYKVSLKIRVQGKLIRARFTLANRAGNRYPILIGRRTLSNHFVVDVSRSQRKSGSNVLILVNKRFESVDKLVAGIQADSKNNLKITVATYDEIVCEIGENLHMRLITSETDVASFDLIYFKNIERYSAFATSIARYVGYRGVSFIDRAVAQNPISNKLYQYVVLRDANIRVPNTFYATLPTLKQSYERILATCGKTFILKDPEGNKGKNNFLIKNKAEFVAAYKQAERDGCNLLAQSYIPNDGHYRVLVLENTIALAMFRKRDEKSASHLSSSSKKAEVKILDTNELKKKVQSDCMLAASLLRLEIAGVDMVEDKTDGSWYCLEVNHSPQIASGSFVEEKRKAIAMFLQSQLL